MKFIRVLLFSVFCTIIAYGQVQIKEPGKKNPSAFAIIVDKTTYDKCTAAIDAYKNAVEEDGLSTYIVINNWKNPDEIKAEIVKLTKKNPPIEGVVLVGDIPIPMIRNAQHMTTAFKIDQSRGSMFKNSAPSDRFYDALDLRFKFIKQDSVHKLSFYYNLLPESPQKIIKTIYSGRIKPPVEDETKYEVITNYLNRVVLAKKEQRAIDNAFVFTGHGYNSEALTAWGDETLALREQFPDLYKPGNRLKKLNHTMDNEMKNILLTELQDPKLDIAIFHAHGAEDLQYINNYPEYRNPQGNIEQVKLYLRSKLRTAQRRKKSVDTTIAMYVKDLDVPKSWFEGTFSDSLVAADSLLDYSLDIHIEDVRKIAPQPALMVFDECFNGSVHQDDYIAGEYVFGKGKTIAGVANTTNALQDQWIDELVGLLNYGVRIGQWHKFNSLLESHLFGDPTYHFANTGGLNLTEFIREKKNDEGFWRDLLKNESPVARSLATCMLFNKLGADFEKDLVNIYKTDNSFNVRMHALKYLASLQTPAFHEILKESISDPYEFIRRISAGWMGLVGKQEYIPYLAERLVTDESERVSFNAKSALSFIDPEESYNECIKYVNTHPGFGDKDKKEKFFHNQILRSKNSLKEEIDSLNSPTLSLKGKINEMRYFRNYTYISAIPEIIKFAEDSKTAPELRVTAIEALGWYSFSYKKDMIKEACEKIEKDNSAPQAVKDEALRTFNRLKDGENNPITH